MTEPNRPAPVTSACASAEVLRIENLSKAFSGRPALDGVGFSLTRGEFAAVLGPSGTGKTTLFRCITGFMRADAGTIQFESSNVTELPVTSRRHIAMVSQQFNLVRRLTALDNALAGRLGHVSAWRGMFRRFEQSDMLQAFECLERVGMLDYAKQRADTLSGGQQQRVAIARALAQEPRLIVADEPVASLDPASAAGVLQLLVDIARSEGVTVLCSLHQIGYARSFADRILGMANGRIVVDVPAGDLDDAKAAEIYQRAQPATDQSPEAANNGNQHATSGLALTHG